MREKLIELLQNTPSPEVIVMGQRCGKAFVTMNVITDHLIANGVTIPVRCKDCKNRDEITKECKHPKAVGWDVIIPEDNDFCSYGERKGNDEF